MILVDTNVLLDVLTGDAQWVEWSIGILRDTSASEPLVINDIVYAELAGHAANEDDLDAMLAPFRLTMERTPKAALFLAGKAFVRYRRAGGMRSGVLPDFLIGAHAQVSKARLITRDATRYQTYFPKVKLIAPN